MVIRLGLGSFCGLHPSATGNRENVLVIVLYSLPIASVSHECLSQVVVAVFSAVVATVSISFLPRDSVIKRGIGRLYSNYPTSASVQKRLNVLTIGTYFHRLIAPPCY